MALFMHVDCIFKGFKGRDWPFACFFLSFLMPRRGERVWEEKKTAVTTPSAQPAADAEQKLRADVARRCKAQGLEEARRRHVSTDFPSIFLHFSFIFDGFSMFFAWFLLAFAGLSRLFWLLLQPILAIGR